MSGLIFLPGANFGNGAGGVAFKTVQLSASGEVVPDTDGAAVLYNVYDQIADVAVTLDDTFPIGSRVGFVNNGGANKLTVTPTGGQTISYDAFYQVASINTVAPGATVWLTRVAVYGWLAEVTNSQWRFGTSTNEYNRGIDGNNRILANDIYCMSNPSSGEVEFFNMPSPAWPDVEQGRMVRMEFELYIGNIGGAGSYTIQSEGGNGAQSNGMWQKLDASGFVSEGALFSDSFYFSGSAASPEDFLIKGFINYVRGTGGVTNIVFKINATDFDYFQQVFIRGGSYCKWSFVR